MKPYRLLAFGLTLIVPVLAGVTGCAGEQEEGEGAQFPPPPSSPLAAADEPLVAPGEAPLPIRTVPVSPPPPPPQAQEPQEIVVGSTTEEEYEARPPEAPGPEGGYDPSADYADTDPSALTDFRQALDPYGSWVDDPNYGTVWTPSDSVVGSDFAPYVSGGRWTYDDAGSWVWVSDYDWGWAPFHYGRWAYLGQRWGWIPGRRYAGAWVSWRTGYGPWDGYLGWAPLPPAWGWRNGAAFGYGFAGHAPYVFCNGHDVFGPSPGSHVVTGGSVGAVGSHSRVVAAPSAGAGGRVIAQPTVGPAPGSVGIAPNEIARTPINDRGVMHAQQFAHTSTAQALGGHAAMPSSLAPVASSQRYSHGGLGSAAYSRNEPVARSPQYRGIAPTPYHYASRSSGFPSHTIAPYQGYAGYGAHYGSGYSGAPYASPVSRGGAYGGPYGGAYGGYRPGMVTGHPVNKGSPSGAPEEGPGGAFGHGGGGGFRGGGGRGGGHGGGHR